MDDASICQYDFQTDKIVATKSKPVPQEAEASAKGPGHNANEATHAWCNR